MKFEKGIQVVEKLPADFKCLVRSFQACSEANILSLK